MVLFACTEVYPETRLRRDKGERFLSVWEAPCPGHLLDRVFLFVKGYSLPHLPIKESECYLLRCNPPAQKRLLPQSTHDADFFLSCISKFCSTSCSSSWWCLFSPLGKDPAPPIFLKRETTISFSPCLCSHLQVVRTITCYRLQLRWVFFALPYGSEPSAPARAVRGERARSDLKHPLFSAWGGIMP